MGFRDACGDEMRKSPMIRAGFLAALALGTLAFSPAHAGMFGESDEEKAARLHEKDQDDSIADLTQRLHDLEAALRQATGQNESLSHQLQQVNDKLDRQKKDFEYRLCTIAAQQLGAAEGANDEQSGLPCPGGTSTATPYNPPSPGQQQPSSGVHLAPPPGVLGTLSGRQGTTFPPPPAASSQTKSQFDAALDLLAKARYDDARAAFRSFADNNPGDEQAPQAIYWLGDIAYVQKDYASAAHAFVEQLKKYPTSTRSPDSMLKLGQSLIAMGQTKEGCITLGALPSKYPNASKAIGTQAASERKASCR
jgi:tol-pal system protein YbgF